MTLFRAKWFLPVVIGSIAVVTGAFGWGYLKGYGSAETDYQKAMNEALEQQYQELQAQKALEIRLALNNEREKRAIHQRINNVPRPTGGCELTPECLQWYDNILRAASPAGPGPD